MGGRAVLFFEKEKLKHILF